MKHNLKGQSCIPVIIPLLRNSYVSKNNLCVQIMKLNLPDCLPALPTQWLQRYLVLVSWMSEYPLLWACISNRRAWSDHSYGHPLLRHLPKGAYQLISYSLFNIIYTQTQLNHITYSKQCLWSICMCIGYIRVKETIAQNMRNDLRSSLPSATGQNI